LFVPLLINATNYELKMFFEEQRLQCSLEFE